MSKKTKQAWEVKAEEVRAAKLNIINKLGDSNNPNNDHQINTLGYGDIAIWNLITCWEQNAESDKNDIIAHIECALCDETEEAQEFFRSKGFTF